MLANIHLGMNKLCLWMTIDKVPAGYSHPLMITREQCHCCMHEKGENDNNFVSFNMDIWILEMHNYDSLHSSDNEMFDLLLKMMSLIMFLCSVLFTCLFSLAINFIHFDWEYLWFYILVFLVLSLLLTKKVCICQLRKNLKIVQI